jgi:hypothetical protein
MPAIENSGNRSGSASDLKLIRGGVIESHKERAGREEGRQDDEPDQKTVRGPDHDLSGFTATRREVSLSVSDPHPLRRKPSGDCDRQWWVVVVSSSSLYKRNSVSCRPNWKNFQQGTARSGRGKSF